MKIIPYTPADAPLWDETVRASRNGIFQHLRAYMDYHSDRFADCSIMAADERGRIIAVLPAHSSGDTVSSHRGLTFGGWLMTMRADMNAMTEVWRLMTEHYRERGFRQLFYRPSPSIYHTYPAEEDLYALFRAGGRLEATQVSTVVDLLRPAGLDMTCRQSVRKATRAGIAIDVSDNYAPFWAILESLLRARHDASPVHSLAEIELLRSRFPDNIRLYTATDGAELLAGVVMYNTRTAAHSQYTATTERGRALRVLPALYSRIMDDTLAAGMQWMDFGTSNEDGGRILNTGLIRQKCALGGRAIVYNAWSVPLTEEP